MNETLRGANSGGGRQAGVDPKEIQAFLDKRIGQIAGPLDADAMARKASHDKLLGNALTKLKMRDWRAALADLNLLLTNDPYDALALHKRAEAENHLGLYKEAELDARKALALDPGSAGAWQQLAWSLLKQGRYQEALEAINRALALDPANANDYAIRAYIKSMLGDRDGAIADLEKAALLDPHYRHKLDLARQGGRIYDPGEDEDSIADMVSSALGGVSRRPLVLAGLAVILLLAVVGGMVIRYGKAETKRKLAALTPWTPKPALVSPSGAPMIGKYELGRVIGKGGMGEVYAAKDLSLGRPVAIKKMANLLPELGEQGRQLFIKEAKVVASLHHPSIVDIYEIIERGSEVYLVFEFVNGKTIHQLIAEKTRLTPQQSLAILKPVCRALTFAHHHNLVHRDLKPANIMITAEGHLKLMDFGIARSLGDTAAGNAQIEGQRPDLFARTRTVMGTPSYMPPESDSGIVSKQGDVYALGVTLYEMLTGRLPYSAKAGAPEKIAMRYAPATTLVPGLPPAIDTLVKDALQPQPDKRLQTPIEFLSRLKAIVGETVTPF
ncbi:MAG: protein kinase [Elusimicrobia bacterium]|nr:protein kinase [Elusimicrobiota bacterium]